MMKTLIIVVFGIEIRDWDLHQAIFNFCEKECIKLTSDIYTYKKAKQEYEIQLKYSLTDFKSALDTTEAIIIYCGHSRFGQGPAFGDSGIPDCPETVSFPVNPWETHFRMGFDMISIPCKDEILKHCTNPKEIGKTIPKDLFISSHVKKILNRSKGKSTNCKQDGFARRPLTKCYPEMTKITNGRGLNPFLSRDYWYINKKEKDYYTIVESGSKDLNSVTLKCKVLFMYSCKSEGHFYEALLRRKKEVKSRCIFYLTTRLAYDTEATLRFVKLMLKGVNPCSNKGKEKLLQSMNSLGICAGKIIMKK